MQAAAHAFADKGFHATTTRDIASGAGLSPAGVYVHFGSKEELLFDLSRSGHESALRPAAPAIAGRDRASGRAARRRDEPLLGVARRAVPGRQGRPVRAPPPDARAPGRGARAAQGHRRRASSTSSSAASPTAPSRSTDIGDTALALLVDRGRRGPVVLTRHQAHARRDRRDQRRPRPATRRFALVTGGHAVLQIPVPELEPFVRQRHEHYDPHFVSTDPAFVHAHITVLGPFLPPEDIDGRVLINHRRDRLRPGWVRLPTRAGRHLPQRGDPPPARPECPLPSADGCPL